MSTAGQLKESLKDYRDDTPLLWQFYASEHAAIPGDDFEEVAKRLMANQVFLEDLHEFLSEWMESTHTQVKKGN